MNDRRGGGGLVVDLLIHESLVHHADVLHGPVIVTLAAVAQLGKADEDAAVMP